MNTDFSMTPVFFPRRRLPFHRERQRRQCADSIFAGWCLQIYRYQKGALRLWRTLTFGSGLEATSATFFDGAEGSELAVVLSSITEEGSGEVNTFSPVRKKYCSMTPICRKTSEEISLESNDAGALAAEGSKLMLSDDKTIQYYEREKGAGAIQALPA